MPDADDTREDEWTLIANLQRYRDKLHELQRGHETHRATGWFYEQDTHKVRVCQDLTPQAVRVLESLAAPHELHEGFVAIVRADGYRHELPRGYVGWHTAARRILEAHAHAGWALAQAVWCADHIDEPPGSPPEAWRALTRLVGLR
ncbi:hypothetical protein [Euzebya sp.]|uniref:hypothetical protein n=1 Tax=Euzebya sp. TaxID=1971409 RepID=UPI0035150452